MFYDLDLCIEDDNLKVWEYSIEVENDEVRLWEYCKSANEGCYEVLNSKLESLGIESYEIELVKELVIEKLLLKGAYYE